MRSPFPGVDPYLTYWYDALVEGLPDDYEAITDERVNEEEVREAFIEIFYRPDKRVIAALPSVSKFFVNHERLEIHEKAGGPFPGVDPCVELQWTWPDFHAVFITYLRDSINERLPPEYVVRVDERVTVRETAGKR